MLGEGRCWGEDRNGEGWGVLERRVEGKMQWWKEGREVEEGRRKEERTVLQRRKEPVGWERVGEILERDFRGRKDVVMRISVVRKEWWVRMRLKVRKKLRMKGW